MYINALAKMPIDFRIHQSYLELLFICLFNLQLVSTGKAEVREFWIGGTKKQKE